MDNNFNGLRVAITGGTSGLGLALVDALHDAGAKVAFVARDAHPVLRLGSRVSPQVQVVDDERNLDLAGQVGEEERDALEHPDEHQRLAAVIARDLSAERPDACFKLHRRDQDLADVFLLEVLDLQCSVAGFGKQLLVVLAV